MQQAWLVVSGILFMQAFAAVAPYIAIITQFMGISFAAEFFTASSVIFISVSYTSFQSTSCVLIQGIFPSKYADIFLKGVPPEHIFLHTSSNLTLFTPSGQYVRIRSSIFIFWVVCWSFFSIPLVPLGFLVLLGFLWYLVSPPLKEGLGEVPGSCYISFVSLSISSNNRFTLAWTRCISASRRSMSISSRVSSCST